MERIIPSQIALANLFEKQMNYLIVKQAGRFSAILLLLV
jgi:hypothetical protein